MWLIVLILVLILLFGVPPATAVGTDLLYAAITNTGGAWVHNRRGNVDWHLVGWLAASSLPTAALTVWVLKALDLRDDHFAALISTVLGFALILTALAIFFRDRFRQWHRRRGRTADGRRPTRLILAIVVTGVILGLLVTISSVGAGVICMVALLWLFPDRPSVKLVGVDIAHAVPLTAVAGLGHVYLGTVDFVLLGSLLLGSLPGIYIGSHVSSVFPDRILRPTLACMLLLVGGRLVF